MTASHFLVDNTATRTFAGEGRFSPCGKHMERR